MFSKTLLSLVLAVIVAARLANAAAISPISGFAATVRVGSSPRTLAYRLARRELSGHHEAIPTPHKEAHLHRRMETALPAYSLHRDVPQAANDPERKSYNKMMAHKATSDSLEKGSRAQLAAEEAYHKHAEKFHLRAAARYDRQIQNPNTDPTAIGMLAANRNKHELKSLDHSDWRAQAAHMRGLATH